MNGNNSMTAKAERLPNNDELSCQWNTIDWERAEVEVNRLQVRIAKATEMKNWNAVKRLQYLLTHSYYAKALAVRKVTTNKGKNTSGVDKELWTTPSAKMKAVLTLTDKNYKAKPLRRVFIEKKGKKAKRPLGIPCMYDRAMQGLYALALDPVAEVTADKRSFGFRKGRSCHDACGHMFNALCKKHSATWVLEGDIKGCFDNISHDWLIANIPTDKSVLKQFLKAGFIFKKELFPTEDGTPQGGVISPILANMTLDGIEKVLSDRFHVNKEGKFSKDIRNSHKVNLVRYADDFIVTAKTKEIAEEAKELMAEFLQGRGLELSEEKTLITHIDDGFDMLGWTFRKFKGKLIIKPSKKSIDSFVARLSETILRKGKAWGQELLILRLNQQLRGWTNYHQPVCAKETFSHIDNMVFNLLWRWGTFRHPKKGKRWIANKYWQRKGTRAWVFKTEKNELFQASAVPIIRHNQIRIDANPYLEPEYFVKCKFDHGMKRLSGHFKRVWRNQKGCCHHCKQPMAISDEREIFFLVPKSQGGLDTVMNMIYVHQSCNRIYFERSRWKQY